MDNVIEMVRRRLAHAVIDGPDLRTPNPKEPRSGDLGPNQLAWCEEKLHGFASHRRQAQDAKAHSERSRGAA